MRHEYKKPTIEISHWAVSSKDIEKLYDFFVERFPESNTEITLTTQGDHSRIYESFNEYLEDVPKIISNHEVVSKINIGKRQGPDMHVYKQIWVNIVFGKLGSASMHVIGGDIDGSYQDWIEGSYTKLNKLRGIFEITNEKVVKVMEKDYDGIIFDPEEKIYKKIIEFLEPKQNIAEGKIDIVVQNGDEKLSRFTIKQLIVFLFSLAAFILGTWLVYRFGWASSSAPKANAVEIVPTSKSTASRVYSVLKG